MLVGICLLAGWAYVVMHSDALTQPIGDDDARSSPVDSPVDWPQATQETNPAYGARAGVDREEGESSTLGGAAGTGGASAGTARGSRGNSAGAAAAAGAVGEGLGFRDVASDRRTRSGRQGGHMSGGWGDEYGLQRGAGQEGFRDMGRSQGSRSGRGGGRVSGDWADEHKFQRGTGALPPPHMHVLQHCFFLAARRHTKAC